MEARASNELRSNSRYAKAVAALIVRRRSKRNRLAIQASLEESIDLAVGDPRWILADELGGTCPEFVER